MRSLILFCCITSFSNLKAQLNENQFHCQRDKIISETNQGSVYITRDRNCSLYNWLFPDTREITKIFIEFPELTDQQFPSKSNGNISNYWNDLYEYKGQYYVYGPSDWMSNRPMYLMDSFLVVLSSDLSYFRILDKKQVSPDNLTMKIDFYGVETNLKIQLLSFPEGASLWEYSSEGKVNYELKTTPEKVRNFDFINNDCGQIKCFQNFNFDNLDLTKLKY
jgi:hypothetical protein